MWSARGIHFFALLAAIAVSITAVASALASPDSIVTIESQPPSPIGDMRPLGHIDARRPLSLAIVLPLRNQDELAGTLDALYDPTSSNYHRFLTPSDFEARFSPTESQYSAVEKFVESNGMTVTGTHANRLVIDVSGPASIVEKAFHVTLRNYQSADGRVVYATEDSPKAPASIAGCIDSVIGFDDIARIRPSYIVRTARRGASNIGVDAGSGTTGLYTPADIRNAYNLSSVANPGSGQTLALMELDGYSSGDISQYETQFGLPTVPLQNTLIDAFSGKPSGDGGEVEVALDIELGIALAPSVSKILVYEAPCNYSGMVDCFTQIAADDAASQISTSWVMLEAGAGSVLPAENNIFEEMAAQGQSIYAAAGDDGAYPSGGSVLGVQDPASQPYVCGVGGTTLKTTSNQGYSGESTWIDGGGGVSETWTKPSYQAGYGLSQTMRDVPDVSLDSDPNSGYQIYVDGGWLALGGTSCAAPLWASFTAIVNQARAANGLTPLGFPNPALYSIAEGPHYASDFHDIADNSTNGYYIAVPGYDDATGLGSYNGADLLADLSSATPPAANEQAAPTGVSAAVAGSSTNVSWIASPGATGYNVLRGASLTGPFALIGTSTGTSYGDTTSGSVASYHYVVTAVGPDGVSPNSLVSGAPTPSAAGPANLTATAVSTTQIDLAWTAYPGAKSYTVERGSTHGGPYSKTFTTATNGFNDTSLAAGTTYYYVVVAAIASGATQPSSEASAITAPFAPSTVTARAAGTTQINITWSVTTGAFAYNVLRGAKSGGPYTKIGSTSALTLQYPDTNLTAATPYFYVIQARNTGGSSVYSPEATTTTQALAPTNVAAEAVSGTQIDVTWTASAGAASYNVLCGGTSGGPYYPISSVTATSYANSGLTANTAYYYVVQAVTAGGPSANSSQVTATTAPAAPAAVTAKAVSTSQIDLTWTASSGATGYVIERSGAASGPFSSIGAAAASSYSDTGLTAGTTYYYAVEASVSTATGSASSVVHASTVCAPPIALLATAVNGSQVALTWSVSAGATSYDVLRGTQSGGPYAPVGTAAQNSYTDSGLSATTAYYYVVDAVDSGGTSANSNEATATTLVGAPGNLVAKTAGMSAINLTWSAVAGVSNYNVLRGLSHGGPYSQLAVAASGSYSDTGLSAATTYYYVVQSLCTGGTSANSAEASATTLPAAPTNLTATATGSSQISLTWNLSTHATSYIVLRGTVSGGTYTAVGTAVSSVFNDSGLSSGATYYYVVEAVVGGNASANSNQASATTCPAGPLTVVAKGVSPSAINISWTASAGATSYTVERGSAIAGPFATVGSAATTSYGDSSLACATTYYYVIQATSSISTIKNNPSSNSAPSAGTTLANAPANLVATAAPGVMINLTWTASTRALSYNVLRGTRSGGPYTAVGSTSTASYLDKVLSAATKYYYVVQAYTAGGPSADSAEASAMTSPLPPAGLAANVTGTSTIGLTWTASAGATGYTILRGAMASGPFAAIGKTTTATSYSDTGLTSATLYAYVVEATDAGGAGANSAPATGDTLAAPPTNLVATASGSTLVNLSWTASPRAGSYTVLRSKQSGGPYAVLGTSIGASYPDKTVSAGTAYYYVVEAKTGGGASANSNQATVTTPKSAVKK
jgi:fibronectin type 3 domain-containing protein